MTGMPDLHDSMREQLDEVPYLWVLLSLIRHAAVSLSTIGLVHLIKHDGSQLIHLQYLQGKHPSQSGHVHGTAGKRWPPNVAEGTAAYWSSP